MEEYIYIGNCDNCYWSNSCYAKFENLEEGGCDYYMAYDDLNDEYVEGIIERGRNEFKSEWNRYISWVDFECDGDIADCDSLPYFN